MTDRSDYTSRDYAWEAESSRNRLADSLEALGSRLTPGQVLDEMFTYARGGGGTFLRAFTNAARENPIPSLLIGAGCMLFLSEKAGLNRYLSGDRANNGTTGGGGVSQALRGAARSVQSGVGGATEAIGEQASTATEALKSSLQTTGSAVREQLAGATDKIAEGARAAGETLQDYSAEMRSQISATAQSGLNQARSTAEQLTHKAEAFINDQPLLLVAAGLAVGAMIAAALPSTRAEDELMGEASDKVKDTIGTIASEQYQAAKDTASRVVEKAKTAAEEQGLTSAAAPELVREVGDKIRTVMRETTTSAQTEAREAAGTPKAR